MTLFRLAAAFVLCFIAVPAAAQTVAQAAPTTAISVTSPKPIASFFSATSPSQPTIEIAPPADDQPLRDALASPNTYDWIVFTSPNGARFTRQRLDALGQRQVVFRKRADGQLQNFAQCLGQLPQLAGGLIGEHDLFLANLLR